MFRLGVVSFLNSRPLIEGLPATGQVRIVFDLPARLPDRLAEGALDAALVPFIDVLRAPDRLGVISDACIGCDGETMTVRVFSQQPPDRIRRLHADMASHTSLALAQILWRELFEVDLDIREFDPRTQPTEEHEAVLLIGDKVVDPTRGNTYGFEVDLGAAWRHHTGLPFVFAVWAVRRANAGGLEHAQAATLAALLTAARDRGVRRADELVDEFAPALGWPRELAKRYLTRCLSYRLTERLIAGAERFAALAARHGLVPPEPRIPWLEDLRPIAPGRSALGNPQPRVVTSEAGGRRAP